MFTQQLLAVAQAACTDLLPGNPEEYRTHVRPTLQAVGHKGSQVLMQN